MGEIPLDFGELTPFIQDAYRLIRVSGVKKINSDDDSPELDFSERNREWAVLVGGQKLSRGFTIEGLSISYLARKPGAIDTLVQMARWCGYRQGYADLVRIYLPELIPGSRSSRKKRVGRNSPIKKPTFYQLRAYFRQAAIMEHSFREQLLNYSGKIKPADMRPLVQRTFEGLGERFAALRPTSISKSRHIEYVQNRLSGDIMQLTKIGGSAAHERNLSLLVDFLGRPEVGLQQRNFNFSGEHALSNRGWIGRSTSKDYLSFLRSVDFGEAPTSAVKTQEVSLPKMPQFEMTIVLFEPKDARLAHNLDVFAAKVWTRDIEYGSRDRSITVGSPYDPDQRRIARWFSCHRDSVGITTSDAELQKFQSPNNGVLHFVLFTDKNQNSPGSPVFYLWETIYPDIGGKITFSRVRKRSAGEG